MPLDPALLERFHQTLVDEIRRSRPEYLRHSFTVGEIYQDLIPYRTHRDAIGVGINGDYEDALLRLLGGEGNYLILESERARSEIRQELESNNPNTSLFRDFASVDVRLNPTSIEEGASEEDTDGPTELRGAESTEDPTESGRAAEPSGPTRVVAPESPALADAGVEDRPHVDQDASADPQATAPSGAASDSAVFTHPVDGSEDAPRVWEIDPEPTRSASTGHDAVPSEADAATEADAGTEARDETRPDAAVRSELDAPAAAEPESEGRSEAGGEPDGIVPDPNELAPEPAGAAPDLDQVAPEPEGVALAATDPHTRPGAGDGEERGTCRWCDADLPHRAGLNFCPHCGADLRLAPCVRCGEPLEAAWRYCVACGSAVTST